MPRNKTMSPIDHLAASRRALLRADPFERGDESDFFYAKWFSDHDFLLISAQAVVAKWLESFKEFPPRAEAASFTIDKVVEKLMPRT